MLELACLCLAPFLSHAAADAATISPSQLSGWVYIDRNNDGQLQFADEPKPDFIISNVKITLYELNGAQEVEVATALTDDQGRYVFSGLAAGTYTLRQTQPVEFVDGLDALGTLRSLQSQSLPPEAFAGTMGADAFTGIVLPAGVAGEMYNFGELGFAPGYISKRYLLTSAPPMPSPDRNTIPEPASSGLLAWGVGMAFIGCRRTRMPGRA